MYRHSYSGVLLLQSLTQYIEGYLILFSVSVILFADLCLDDENSATRCVKSTNTIVQIKSKIGALEEIGNSQKALIFAGIMVAVRFQISMSSVNKMSLWVLSIFLNFLKL
jgi:hypothetical protein